MKNGHRKRWAYDRRSHKWINLKKVKVYDLIRRRYDLEPNGFVITESFLEKLRPVQEAFAKREAAYEEALRLARVEVEKSLPLVERRDGEASADFVARKIESLKLANQKYGAAEKAVANMFR